MIYPKPRGVRYTDMAIWIDANAYTVGFDEEKMYRYLYHLAIMLSNKKKMFQTSEETERFALYVASRIYLRLINKKQFMFKEDGTTLLPRISSVLNYMKKTLNVCKIDFQEEENISNNSVSPHYVDTTSLAECISDNTNVYDNIDFVVSIGSVSNIIKTFLSKIPYKKDSAEWTNIYISCLLSLLNMMTPTIKRMKSFEDRGTPMHQYIEKLYYELRYEDPILFHLDKSYKGYIKVLVNELKHCISAELSWKSGASLPSDAVVMGVLMSDVNSED